MHFTLQQLKLFESVARNNSFTRASEELNLTQPAVSIQVKRLEEQVDLPLFEHIGKRIFLTHAGSELYAASRDILSRITDLKATIDSLRGEIKGSLKLSVVTTSKYFMPHLLGAFLQLHPAVEPRLKFTNRANVMQRLQENIDDFVVMGQVPKDSNLVTRPFLENILVVVAHPHHPLAKKNNIQLEQLITERFIVREQGSGTRLVFEQLLEQNHIALEPYMELGSSEAIKQGVMAGLGLAVLSLHSLALELETNKLIVLNVKNFPLKRRWYAVYLKNKRLSLVAQTFIEFILEHGQAVLDNNTRL